MIITRTPFRISFFGGGTDYPDWYQEHGGAVLATSIDKYCYISCRRLRPFFKHRHRIVYSKIELVSGVDEILHPTAREVMRYLNVNDMDDGLEIHHDGDLPARSGIGTSPAFTVGLLHAIYGLQGIMPSKKQLTQDAIHVEQNMIRDVVGAQDQAITAHGGLCHITFSETGDMTIRPIILKPERRAQFQGHLMLFHTDIYRNASDVAQGIVDNLSQRSAQLNVLREMVDEGLGVLTETGDIGDFGKLLHESWKVKRELSDQVTNPYIDEIYEAMLETGALGGKILGAGSGGFMLCFARPECHETIRERLAPLPFVPVSLESHGSQVVFYNP